MLSCVDPVRQRLHDSDMTPNSGEEIYRHLEIFQISVRDRCACRDQIFSPRRHEDQFFRAGDDPGIDPIHRGATAEDWQMLGTGHKSHGYLDY